MPSALPPLSLYIHIPWCEKKCPYCDFNSHENKKDFSETEYIDCLIADLQQSLDQVQNRSLQSIFIGGGTPSLFRVENIDRLLTTIAKEVSFSSDIEITLEANPASSQSDYFSSLSQTLVNRVSLGVQSFQTDKLSQLGRLHSSDEAQLAISALNDSFDNFNIDLMFGLKDQSLADSLFDLETALSFNPHHLSWYQLTIEANTVFYRERPVLPNENLVCDMQIAGQKLLGDYGLTQYEISAYAAKGRQSQHNVNYWQFGDYLAIGAGAHGKITTIQNGRLEIKRFQKKRMPVNYINGMNTEFIAKSGLVAQEDLALEFFMNSLRLNQEGSLDLFTQRTGLNKNAIDMELSLAERKGLIQLKDGYILKTELGQRHLDTLLSLF